MTSKYAKLAPSLTSILNKGEVISGRINDALAAITEEVEVLSVNIETGNAKVRDNRGRVFYCAISDLRHI